VILSGDMEESRFEEIDISEENVDGIIELIKSRQWIGLVDDKTGGIVAVGKSDMIGTVARILNLLNSK
jgi:hypothetical protein